MVFGEIHEHGKVFHELSHGFYPEDDNKVPVSGNGRVDVSSLMKEQ